MLITEPTATLTVTRRVIVGKVERDYEILEGECPMPDPQTADAVKSLIGDGAAKVTVSRELSEADYGNGGKVFVAITLTCDQSQQAIHAATGWAKHLADTYVVEQHAEMRQRLLALGITGQARA